MAQFLPKGGNWPHAVLLESDGAEALSFAREAAARLLCPEGGENCRCSVCRRVREGIHPDVTVIDRGGKDIAVDDIRAMRQDAFVAPLEGNRKVYLILHAQDMNGAAQNAALKLLEEPPEGVYFLLGATSAFAVLPTVLSRVKKLEIPALDAGLIQGALSRVYGTRFSENEYAVCAVACGGVLGEAQEMLEGGVYKALIEDAFALVQGDAGSLPALVKRIGETKRKKQLLSLLRLIYRDATVQKKGFGGENAIFLRGEKARIQRVADAYALPALLRAQAYITDAEKQLYFNAVFPQCLEILMAKIYENNV